MFQSGGLSQWAGGAHGASGSMNASIILDQPGNVAYTNLDEISGRVVVRSGKSENVNSIVVKLEGESRTRLLSPPGQNGERPKPMIEYHKILYRTAVVFPPQGVAEQRLPTTSGKASYGLPAGQHEFPFIFKIPFNNNCLLATNHNTPTVVGMEIARPATRHVKKTLPPTLGGFPGEAEIRYFVKCTVNRHSFFKENARAYSPFSFFPIEPPRPPLTGSEVFARQRAKFDAFPGVGGEPVMEKMKGIFGKKSSAPNSPTVAGSLPSISIDARLPEPAILTCNHVIPLRLLVKKLTDFHGAVHMQSLQISLIGHTKIRAHEVYRTESNSWIITSKSNMGVPLGNPTDPVETETVIDDALWRGEPLPNTIAPGFATCNIERTYQLDIRIGLSYSSGESKKVRIGQYRTVPQQIVLPLRLDTQVYSGIAPPPEVLARMKEVKASGGWKPSDPMAEKIRIERQDSDFGKNQIPPTPTEASGSMAPAWPAHSRSHGSGPSSFDDAPPSYEDAIADRAGPVTAPRPTYAVPPPTEDPLLGGDEKKG